LASEEMESKLN